MRDASLKTAPRPLDRKSGCSTWNIFTKNGRPTLTDRPGSPFLVTRHRVGEDRPGALRLRVVQLTDLHLHPGYPPQKLARLAQLVNAQQPDLIVFTGDFLRHASPHPLPPGVLGILSGIKARYGRYAVRGNHDLRGWPSQTACCLKRAGFTLLRNQQAAVPLPGGRRLVLAGLDDGVYHLADPRTVRALKKERGFRLVLAHEPMLARLVPPGAAELVLAGHTHAGQLRWLFAQNFWMPTLAGRCTHGWYAVNGNPLYVSAGLGESGIGLRILCPAELPVFDCWLK